MMQQLIERGLHRRQRRQMLDQPVAAHDRLARLHRLAIAEHRPRQQIAVVVRVASRRAASGRLARR